MAKRTNYDVHYNLYITSKMYDDIQHLSDLLGVSHATLTRQAIYDHLASIRKRIVYDNKIRQQFNDRVAESKPDYNA